MGHHHCFQINNNNKQYIYQCTNTYLMHFLKTCYCSEDDQSMPATVTKPVGLPGSSIKVTLKKTRSCSSTSSRESAQSFEVRNLTLNFSSKS